MNESSRKIMTCLGRPALFLILLALGRTAAASWIVEFTQGDAWVESSTGKVEVKVGSILGRDQVLSTANDGRVELKEGLATVWVSGGTRFKISDAPAEDSKKKVFLNLLQGKVRARFDKSEREREASFKVKMRSVVCGVRGTELFAAVGIDDEKVCTIEGHVVVNSLEAGGPEWELPAGKGLFITAGQRPEVKDTSSALVSKWVAATSTAAVYSVPWQLRPVTLANSARVDSAIASYDNTHGHSGGSAVASVYSGAFKFADRESAVLRVATVSSYPTDGAASGTSYSNPLLGMNYDLDYDPYLKVVFFAGVTLPTGNGGGNTPDGPIRAANTSAMLARSAMDNALFAVNYFAVIPGIDVAYIKNQWTLQFETTLFQLTRAGGEQVDKDALRTNLTSGLELGYALGERVSFIGELHYQRWLSNDTVFAQAAPGVENLSLALGLRLNLKLAENVAVKPGLAYERGLVGPIASGGFSNSPVNNEQILFFDVPIVF